MYCINHQSVPRHTYKNTVYWKENPVCWCACVPGSMHYKRLGPVIGAHTYHLSVSLKLQNRDRIKKVSPFSIFCPIVLGALPSSVSVSLWPFVHSSARLINHTHSGMRWYRWEQGGFITTALEWEGESDGGGGRGLELCERSENMMVFDQGHGFICGHLSNKSKI